MPIETIISALIPVFAIIAASFIFGKFKKISLEPVLDITVYLAVPCLVFYTVAESEFMFTEFFILFLAVAAVILIGWLVAYFWLKSSGYKDKGFYLPLLFPNTGNMGLPIILLSFGAAGLAKAVIYNTFTSLFMFSIGVYLVARKANFKEIFMSPLIYSLVLGALFAVMQIKLPAAIISPIKLVGDSAIPLQLIILGYSLSSVKLKSSVRLAVHGALFRFIVGFLVALAFVSIFNIGGLTRQVILLESIMPSALFCIILSQKYKRDAELVASTVFISTLISLILIPIVLSLI